MFIKTTEGTKGLVHSNTVIHGGPNSGKTSMCYTMVCGVLDSVKDAIVIICNNEEPQIYHGICSEFENCVILLEDIDAAFDLAFSKSKSRMRGSEDSIPVFVFIDGTIPSTQYDAEFSERLLTFNRNSNETNVYLTVVSNQPLFTHYFPTKIAMDITVKNHSYATARACFRYGESSEFRIPLNDIWKS